MKKKGCVSMSDCLFDYSIEQFPRLETETDDSPRIKRAVEATKNGVLYFPKGEYEIAETIHIENGCSLWLHKSAILKAIADMSFVVVWEKSPKFDRNGFIRGGVIDGAGLASCIKIDQVSHFTIKDMSLYNGKKFGFRAGNEITNECGGCEIIASNLYCKCTMSGLAGNVGMSICTGDSHYTDCIVIDYTIGVDILMGSVKLTRVHVWGGPVPPRHGETIPEMLVDSISFRVNAPDVTLNDCYADTGEIGFQIHDCTRLNNCTYLSTYSVFPLNCIKVIDHRSGHLTASHCYFRQFEFDRNECMVYCGNGENLYADDIIVEGDGFKDAEEFAVMIKNKN